MSRLMAGGARHHFVIWDARPYVRWETDDIEPDREDYADLSLEELNPRLNNPRHALGMADAATLTTLIASN